MSNCKHVCSKFGFLVCLLLTGCLDAHTTVPYPRLTGIISSELPEECVNTIMEADTWLLNQVGLEYLESIFDYKIVDDFQEEDLHYREVAFVQSYRIDLAGYANYSGITDNLSKIFSGKIELKYCNSRSLVAHELGHIFGLEHSDDPNNFMYRFFGGQKLTDEQKETLVQNILLNVPY